MSEAKEIPYEKSALERLGKKDVKEVTDEEWKSVLTPHEYEITRKAGTELPNTGNYNLTFNPGKYTCKCCGTELFVSDAKFRTKCGWPAFGESVGKDLNIIRLPCFKKDYERTEIRCKICDAHLGHVFQEDNTPTGERYCVNSCAIDFKDETPSS
uniref:Peptide-methionine (R)-S-oxide reductase n=1 Tax=Panagrellus redivivus TaxID=6233 RepID=A0A7E4VSU1_PANRE